MNVEEISLEAAKHHASMMDNDVLRWKHVREIFIAGARSKCAQIESIEQRLSLLKRITEGNRSVRHSRVVKHELESLQLILTELRS